jgi:hypothetical protein
VKIDLDMNKAATLSRWISRQHDGAISYDLRQNYNKFRKFVEHLAMHVQGTVRNMLATANATEPSGNDLDQRNSSLKFLEALISQAMEHAAVSNFGRIKWMAHVIISDLEEFVVNPVGPIHFSEIPAGIYSQLGHEMVNCAEGTSWSYQETSNNH